MGGPLDLSVTVGATPSDLFESAMSLAGNFWGFFFLGMAFIVAPWIFRILRAAISSRSSRV